MVNESLESSKNLCGVGAVLVALGSFIPFLGLVGIILVLVGLKGLADSYGEPTIFLDALCGFVFGVMGFAAAIFALICFLSGFVFISITPGTPVHPCALLYAILILAAVFAFFLLEAFFYRRSFRALAQRSSEKLFNTAGTLLLVGAALTVVVVGFLLMFAAWVIAAVAFFSMKSQRTAEVLK